MADGLRLGEAGIGGDQRLCSRALRGAYLSPCRRALGAQSSGSARVFVSTAGRRVAGYYALAAAELRPENATERARKGQPRRRPLPAVLLARLAVDLDDQGKGLGRSLLQDAMLRVNEAAEELGIRLMLVHAKHQRASRWYRRFGFEVSPTCQGE